MPRANLTKEVVSLFYVYAHAILAASVVGLLCLACLRPAVLDPPGCPPLPCCPLLGPWLVPLLLFAAGGLSSVDGFDTFAALAL
mmetsp:Transcript_35609/g.101845  ORF Transcript_35609/g.101845 Transcript_35609/m.101845 type:complete len:84 (-) Transcript_35609:180-431(-)